MLLRDAGFAHATEQVYAIWHLQRTLDQQSIIGVFGGVHSRKKRNRKLY